MSSRRPRVPKVAPQPQAGVGLIESTDASARAPTRPPTRTRDEEPSASQEAYADRGEHAGDLDLLEHGVEHGRHPVGGHSAKVIPLEPTATRHGRSATEGYHPASESRRAAERRGLREQPSARRPPSTTAPVSRATRPSPERPAAPRVPTTSGSRPARRPGMERNTASSAGTRSAVTTAGTRSSQQRAPDSPAEPDHRPDTAGAPGTAGAAAPSRRGSTEQSRAQVRSQTAGHTKNRTGGQSAGQPSRSHPTLEPVPARSFTGRTVIFAVVLLVAAILVAPTLRVFLNQQAEISATQQDIGAQEQREQELTEQIQRWEDPAYVQQQARDRLNLVMPGEKKYMVIGGQDAAGDPGAEAATRPEDVNTQMPWGDALWDSVVRAGLD